MKIQFGNTTIHLPAEVDEVQIIMHKNDQIEFSKTNHPDYMGLTLRKGDRAPSGLPV